MFIDLHLGPLHEPLNGRQWDRSACLQRGWQRATALQRQGVKRGDRVFLHYGNSAEFFFDILALWNLGACPAPVDPRFTAFEIGQLAQAVAPAFSVWDRPPSNAFANALAAHNVRLLDTAFAEDIEPALLSSGLPQLDDAALILFTSGTTGHPKGVVHTHRSLRARWVSQRERLSVAPYERTLCLLPTNFAWGLVGNCLYPWLSGQALFILPAFRPDVVLQLGKLCDEHRITYLPTVPTMWRIALRTVAPPKANTLVRVACGTSPLPAALWRDIGAWSSAREVMNVYGITETGWLAGSTTPDVTPEDGLIGTPWGTVMRVLDKTSSAGDPTQAQECRTGESGHLWVQTPALMRGYYGRDDFTRQVITRGWFDTGDMGYVDDRGLLFIRGREKDVINVAGVKVYPGDIDSVAERCDGVAEACAFPIEDALQGDSVGIALVLRERNERQLALVYRWTAERVARHQLPRRWYLLDEIPRTPRGKVDRTRVASACASLEPIEQRDLERGQTPRSTTAGQ